MTIVVHTAPDPPSFAMLDMNATWAKVAWEPSRSGVPGSVFYVQYRKRGQLTESRDDTLTAVMQLTWCCAKVIVSFLVITCKCCRCQLCM